ncbi:MAG: hypothetical protein QM731_20385 [Chitinophagaceae bacterium]
MKRKFLYLSLSACLLAIVSCKDSGTKQSDDNDDSVIVIGEDTAFSVETIDTFNTLAFSGFAKQKAPGFDWGKFRMTSSWKADSLRTTNFNPSDNFFAAYGKLLKYSPDSSYFVDLDSYSFDVRKDSSTGRWKGTDMGTDTEISLINLATKQKERILFLGPGGSIDDAYWLDKNNFILIGVQDEGAAGKAAALWKFNVPEKIFYLYEWKDATAANSLIRTWRKQRLAAALQ